MKRGVIAVILLVICFITAGIQYVYVTSNTSMFVKMIEEADEYIENDDILSAQDAAYRLDHRYQETEQTLNIFIYHANTDAIARDIAMMRRYTQTSNSSDFLAASAACKRALMCLFNNEIPCFQNIM